MPMKILDWKTPFEMLHGMPPSYDHLRVIENVFPFKKDCVSFGVPSSTQQWPLKDVASDEDSAPYYVPDISSDHVVLNTPFDHDISNISFDIPKPNSYSQAANDPKWVEAMRKELQALRTNDTWVLTELPDGHKAISSKWVYKIRYFADGTVERYKARLVIRGFDQKEGVDYKHTFSLVAKAVTVRVLITITTAKGWPLHQLDINNAFLRGFVDEKIYMKPPEGEPHLQAATHLLRYLNGSINKGLFYPVQSNLKVTGFSYADWASYIMTRKSLTGYCIFLGHYLVS
nr:retrovirus-related Pol polyprotein from transposon TNT 1-94 [Tanacetum cinerariifolium]